MILYILYIYICIYSKVPYPQLSIYCIHPSFFYCPPLSLYFILFYFISCLIKEKYFTLFYSIFSYLIVFFLSYPRQSYLKVSYHILSYLILCRPILPCLIIFYLIYSSPLFNSFYLIQFLSSLCM